MAEAGAIKIVQSFAGKGALQGTVIYQVLHLVDVQTAQIGKLQAAEVVQCFYGMRVKN